MPTPTEKPVDKVTVCLSDSDFCRIIGNAVGDDVLRPEYKGRIECFDVRKVIENNEPVGWAVDCFFIPEEGS